MRRTSPYNNNTNNDYHAYNNDNNMMIGDDEDDIDWRGLYQNAMQENVRLKRELVESKETCRRLQFESSATKRENVQLKSQINELQTNVNDISQKFGRVRRSLDTYKRKLKDMENVAKQSGSSSAMNDTEIIEIDNSPVKSKPATSSATPSTSLVRRVPPHQRVNPLIRRGSSSGVQAQQPLRRTQSEPIAVDDEDDENEEERKRLLKLQEEADQRYAMQLQQQLMEDEYDLPDIPNVYHEPVFNQPRMPMPTRGRSVPIQRFVQPRQRSFDPTAEFLRQIMTSDPLDNASYEELLALDEQAVKVGIPKNQLAQYPTHKYQSRMNKSSDESDNKCMVCFEEYQDREELKTVPCMHKFHSGCIDKWLEDHKKCPICNIDLSEIRH